ncbi:MAG: PKD domain-containing protein [Planctomycetota bacterium]
MRFFTTLQLVALFALLLGGAASADGQFIPPIQASAVGSGCLTPRVTTQTSNNIGIVFERSGDIFFSSTSLGLGSELVVSTNPLHASRPDIMPATGGAFRIVYQQVSTQLGAVGDDILTVANAGGLFGSPLNITFTADADFAPRITTNSTLARNVVWHRNLAGVDEVFLSANLLTNSLVDLGRDPAIADIADGTSTIAYERAGVIYYRQHNGGAFSPEGVISVLGGNSDVDLATDAVDVVHAIWLRAGGIQYSNNFGGAFSAPVQIHPGPIVGEPSIAATADGHVAVAFASAGSIWLVERTAGVFLPAVDATPGTGAVSEPNVTLDSNGFAHIAYIASGSVFYINNVPVPEVDFSADPTSGQLFLTVQFTNLVTGVYDSLLWDFGDGETSTEAHPLHIYDTSGLMTVSLTATGPGGVVTETKTGFINAQPPTNIIRIPHISIFASQQDVIHPVLATNSVPVQGFQLAIGYNHLVTPISGVTFVGSTTQTLLPEFVFIEATPAGTASTLVVAVVFDVQEPFDGRAIAVGPNHLIAGLSYDVPFGLPMGSVSPILLLREGIGTPTIYSIYTFEGITVNPFLIDGSATVNSVPQETFLRGDANRTGIIDISDAIFLLTFLFASGGAPSCPDSADANDTGITDIADVIYLLSYLFAGGAPPSYPYPVDGLDPSADSLGPCLP